MTVAAANAPTTVRAPTMCLRMGELLRHGCQRARSVLAGRSLKSDIDPIPTVDRHNGERKGHQLLLVELLVSRIVNIVRYPLMIETRHRLRPGQCSPLSGSVNRRT